MKNIQCTISLLVVLLFFAFSNLNAQCPGGITTSGPIQFGDVGTCTPMGGMLQWDGTDYQIYDPVTGTWENLLSGTSSGSSPWLPNPNGIHYDEVSGDNVGIGTSNPLSKLSVGGDGNANGTVSVFTPTTSSSATGLRSEIDGTTGFASHVRAISGHVKSGYGYTYAVTGNSTSDTPSSAGRAFGVYGLAGNATSGYNYGVFGNLTGSNNGAGIVGVDNNHGLDVPINGKWAGYFLGKGHFSDKVAIGTTDIPTLSGTQDVSYYNLFVKGGILTEEVHISLCSDWADYVFAPDYDLKSLEEVEAIIEQKGHLHNTPSGQEIQENGIEVGKMMVNQQEKIEELFLHLIDMKKDMDALKAENVALKAEVKSLQE